MRYRVSKLVIATLVIATLFVLPFVVAAQTRDPSCVTDVQKSGDPVICLSVPFGDTVKVSGISEYIGKFYNFSVGAIMSLAVFMIVIAGVQWVFALGNSGKITTAKKTIGNAFMAVILVFISVGMLRIINPDLISLKLPEIKSVDQNSYIGSQACHLLPIGQKVLAYGEEQIIDGNPDNRWMFECGQTYQVVGSGNQCSGTSCYDTNTNEEGVCIRGVCTWGNNMIAGTINWDGNYYVDYMWLMAVCPDNVLVRTTQSKDIPERALSYDFPINTNELLGRPSTAGRFSTQTIKYCGSNDPIGYLLQVEVNDASSPIAWTLDNEVVLGKDCKTILKNANNPNDSASAGDPVAAGIPLFTATELQGAVQCDIDISPTSVAGGGGTPPLGSGITFQPGIESQKPHATVAVINFLNLLAQKQGFVVKSFSDNDLFTGKCEPWRPEFIGTDHNNQLQEAAEYANAPQATRSQFEDFQNDNECVHKKGSAHYGGTILKDVEVKSLSGTVLGKGKAPANTADVIAGKFSCAIDLGPPLPETAQAWTQLQASIEAVGTENASSLMVVKINDEIATANHLHVGISLLGDICYSTATGQVAY